MVANFFFSSEHQQINIFSSKLIAGNSQTPFADNFSTYKKPIQLEAGSIESFSPGT